MSAPRVSVVTPSFRMSEWLRLCVASVADQEGVTHEHLVHDACSDDGTRDWLLGDARVNAVSERDGGMYDALNRGLARARGDVYAHLNCDEQYLPGALRDVSAFLEAHGDVDVVVGHVVVTDGEGAPRAYRRVIAPRALHVRLAHLPFFTAATFVRRAFLERVAVRYDASFRAFGDARFALDLLRHGARFAVLDRYVSVFADTGKNLGADPRMRVEHARLRAEVPRALRAATPLVVAHHRLRRLLAGAYRQAPFGYEVYTRESPSRRVAFRVDRPGFHWR